MTSEIAMLRQITTLAKQLGYTVAVRHQVLGLYQPALDCYTVFVLREEGLQAAIHWLEAQQPTPGDTPPGACAEQSDGQHPLLVKVGWWVLAAVILLGAYVSTMAALLAAHGGK